MSVPERYLRFPLVRRIEHWVTAISFIVLALTGLPQKYAESPSADALIAALGGIETVRIIHRVAAVVLALEAIWHVGYAIHYWYVKRGPLTMLPTRQDAINAWKTLMYNLGREKERPKQGFYTFEEKVEYWALIWGTGIMVLTGFFLWNPITASRLLPGEWIPAAKAAHGGEALLAVLSILIWHLYHVLVRTFNKSMFTGYLSREEMEEEHPLALHQPPPPPLDPQKVAQRKRKFWLGYSIAAVVWAGSVVWFVASEQTAVTTVPPPEEINVYAPLTPTPINGEPEIPPRALQLGTTWENGIGEIFVTRCGECHNPRTGEKNLDLTSLEGALQGGDSGPAIVPGAPGVSIVLLWPTFQDHPGKLSPLERAAIWSWIQTGAPQH